MDPALAEQVDSTLLNVSMSVSLHGTPFVADNMSNIIEAGHAPSWNKPLPRVESAAPLLGSSASYIPPAEVDTVTKRLGDWNITG